METLACEAEARIKAVIEDLKPRFVQNGGDLAFVAYTDGVVFVQFVGTALGYPCHDNAIVDEIEREIRREVPEVLRVCSV